MEQESTFSKGIKIALAFALVFIGGCIALDLGARVAGM